MLEPINFNKELIVLKEKEKSHKKKKIIYFYLKIIFNYHSIMKNSLYKKKRKNAFLKPEAILKT
jgi:hypothetical protein